jgi:hypothetical protein
MLSIDATLLLLSVTGCAHRESSITIDIDHEQIDVSGCGQPLRQRDAARATSCENEAPHHSRRPRGFTQASRMSWVIGAVLLPWSGIGGSRGIVQC